MRDLRLYLALGAMAGVIVIVVTLLVASTAIPVLRAQDRESAVIFDVLAHVQCYYWKPFIIRRVKT
jgi:hypothetical protein